MSKLPDFEGLAMFAKVAEDGSYAAAARSMGVSVATVSRAVSRLEDRLGGRLFNRSSRRLALTEFGQGLAERAGRICAEAEEIEHVALETARRPRGLVRLAAPMAFGVRWIGPILPDFFRLYPDVAVDLHLTDEKIDLIGDGFDAALRIAVMEDSSLVAKLLTPVRRFIVATPSYIKRYGRPQHPDDLAAHPLPWLRLQSQAGCLALHAPGRRQRLGRTGGAPEGHERRGAASDTAGWPRHRRTAGVHRL